MTELIHRCNDIKWKTWKHFPLNERSRLPLCSGIYVVADINDFVWYVGQATNLRIRWTGKTHHRYPQLIRSNRKLNHQIYWKPCPLDQLDAQERYYIERFAPELNGCKVRSYSPNYTKQSQVDRELRRLLKVLNHKTLLFPVVRSIVDREHTDQDGTRCVVLLIYINDFGILANSAEILSNVVYERIKPHLFSGLNDRAHQCEFHR